MISRVSVFLTATLLVFESRPPARAQLRTSIVLRQGGLSSFFVADPNVQGDLSAWDHLQVGGKKFRPGEYISAVGDPGNISIVPDPLGMEGRVYKLTVSPATGFAAKSAQSDRVDLWNNIQPYMGQEGQETWEHFRLLFASSGFSYKPTEGNWNWIVQHHNDDGYRKFVTSGVIKSEKPELVWGVDTRAKLPGGEPTTELFMRVWGGDDLQQGSATTVYADSPLRYDHWYDMLVHVIWSHDIQKGLVEWWLDGKLLYSRQVADLWRRPDSTVDRVNFEFSNYRLHATWNSTVYFSRLKIGPSREAVSF